jgi:hypothetical protein
VAFITTVIFVYLYRMGTSMFVQFYLLSLAVKLLACLAYAVIIVMKDRSGAVANGVYLLVVYFTFTALEVSLLYRRISGRSRS